ncbi:MAG: glycoside hydrolase [Oscillospiraceae bacterium]|nr:glycoside hydrolase [Oscillospiraceae bacterium]
MKIRKIAAAITALLMCVSIGCATCAEQIATEITVYPDEGHKGISPYIYGVNSGVDLTTVSAKSFRLGGNRMTAYNWENNMSNAGSDWHNSADMYLVNNVAEQFKRVPGGAALNASYEAANGNVPYTLLSLQMLGYVSSAKRGQLNENAVAPSEYWKEVVNRKDGEFSIEPDKKDDYIYTEEYLNYLFENIGKSDSETGFKAYALDNEPGLWHHTHSLIQPEHLKCSELIEKSVDLAALVKEMDSGAEVFGPSLFGYSAFDSFAGAPDWEGLKSENDYLWFIDYYLDEMKKAEDECGTRLLDVLDIHFYTEAKGACGERSCNHYDNDECVQARLDSVRSLYEDGYLENSWIVDTGAEFFPLLPNLQQSIDKYYPGTKIAFTEYNFGGGDHISGAVTQADMYGIFAEYGVYFATMWSFDNNAYQLAAINMFTNYDGAGNGFGDTLVKTVCENDKISVYSSVDSEDDSVVKIIAVNKDIHGETPVSIAVSSEVEFANAEVYELYGDKAEIRVADGIENISENSFTYTLKPLSVTEFVVHKKENKLNVPVLVTAGAAVVGAAGIALFLRRRKK